MHILNRLIVLAVLAIFCIPFYSTLAASDETREELTSRLESVMEKAKESYRSARGVRESRLLNQDYIDSLEGQLMQHVKKRRVLRLRVAYLRKELHKVKQRSSDVVADLEQAKQQMTNESMQFRAFVRLAHVRDITSDIGLKDETIRIVFSHLLGDSLGEGVNEDLRTDALKSVRAELMTSLIETGNALDSLSTDLSRLGDAFSEKLSEAETDLLKNAADHKDTIKKIAIAKDEIELTQEQKDEEKMIMTEVSAEVQRIQAALRRIEERRQRQAERDLIRLKIFDPRPGEHANYELPTVEGFVWPVSGPISAGFSDAKYRKRFGWNHNAIDIVTRQGTPVRAAADGVVFKARDGGAKGFSYILLGHGGGLTTLYGHMFQMIISEGSDVKQGQIIGYSGGTPGTYGAGPYTTGAHLHFQATKDGAYVNPLEYLE